MRKKGKKLKSLIRFHRANKINNNSIEGKKGKKRKKSKSIYRASQNIGIIIVFLESLLSEPFPSLGVTVHLTSLGCPPTLLISGPVLGAAQILIRSYSSVFSKCPQLSELVHFLLWELSVTCYIFHRHSLPS